MTPVPAALTALIVTGVACAATLGSTAMTTSAKTSAKDDPLRCELRLTDIGRSSVKLEALAHAGTALRGSYALDIHSAGSGGRSTIRQSGEFDAAAGATVHLGEATVSGTSRTVSADLTLRAGSLERACSHPR